MSYQQAQYTENDLIIGPPKAIKKDISVVVPVYNSEKTIGTLVRRLHAVLEGRYAFEIILVNDGSVDGSPDVLGEMCKSLDNVVVINLSRNFGEHNAVMAGLAHARGEYVITMDDDLQNPPEEILKLIDEAGKGYDVVYGKYPVKKHSAFRNIGSAINNLMVTTMIGKPAGLRLTSFRLMRSYMVRELLRYNAPYTYLDSLILRVSHNIGTVMVEHRERVFGQSNYTFKKLVDLWLNGFMSSSVSPLRIAMFIGVVFLCSSVLSTMIELFEDKVLDPVPWWMPGLFLMLFVAGVQLLSIGVIGEYIGRMYLIQNMTPQYVIKNIVGEDRPE
jgi:polyisoprenyl-phosphate glycosyltransferase